MTTKTTASNDLRELIGRKEELDHEIRERKYELGDVEHKVKRRLIKEGRTDLLKVNWSQVRRQIR